MKYNIKVTQECIDNGTPGNPQSCPIARAIGSLVDVWSLGVTNGYIRFSDSLQLSSYYAIPDEARNFINDYDDGKPVKPFEFVLDTNVLAPDWEKIND